MSVQSDNFFRPLPGSTSTEPARRRRASHSRPDDLETLRAELAEIEQKADEYLRLAQRTQADFINYRRRVEEERAQQARDANVAYMQRLLPVLDDFERALANAAPEELESNWGKGIQLVERNLRGLLAADDVAAHRRRRRRVRPARARGLGQPAQRRGARGPRPARRAPGLSQGRARHPPGAGDRRRAGLT